MTTLRFRAASDSVPTSLIARLRKMTSLSISDIRQRAASGTPLLEITPFENDWEDTRELLVELAQEIATGELPLTVCEVFDEQESPVDNEMLTNLIGQCREIELETQRNTMLESGEISDPDDFEPQDEDWTQ